MVGYGPFSLCVIHKEGLCPSSEDINRLRMNLPYTLPIIEELDGPAVSAHSVRSRKLSIIRKGQSSYG
jgi:hypothetical protein